MDSNRPNILFLFPDQLRADCIFALGNPQIKTPNIDRLVRNGTAFTNCITPSPICVAARHALTSGVSPHRTGCVDNFDVHCKRPSFMQALNEVGYQTHGVGKMHFSRSKGDWQFQSRDISEELVGEADRDHYREFLKVKGFEHVLDPHGLRSEYYYLPQPSQLPDRLHNNSWIADRSIDFLNTRDSSKPFFLWTSFIKPHPPFESPIPWSRLYRMHEMNEPLRPENFEENQSFWNKVQNRYKYRDSGYDSNLSRITKAAYYSAISHVDYHLGRILDSLGPEIDNTLIVFSSDHGEMLGDYGCYGKRCMLDASVRVPLIIRYPKVFPENAIYSHSTTLLDLFPTFLKTAGRDLKKYDVEGIPLQKLLHTEPKDRFVHSQYSQNSLGLYMSCNRKWKYIYSAADRKEWLFQNGDERKNLTSKKEYSDTLAKLRKLTIERFLNDGYHAPVESENWKQFEPPSFPGDPDAGLLIQDPPDLEKRFGEFQEHARNSIDKGSERYNLLSALARISKQTH